jgi:CheY-like chemotaxis protein
MLRLMPDAAIRNVTVLYVEDEEADVDFMRFAFERVGLEDALRTVANGRLAIKYLAGTNGYGDREQHPLPSALLLDLNLPEVSGFEVLKWVRARAEFARLPVVIFSSSSRPEDKARASELGATEFIEKPSSGVRFVDVVNRLREKWIS